MDFDLISGALPIVISIILSLVTLAIMFILRAEDKKDRRLESIKRHTNQVKSEMSQAGETLRQNAAEAEERMVKLEMVAKNLMGEIDSKLGYIREQDAYLSDLKHVMDDYHEILNQLSETTTQVEQRIVQVREERVRLEDIRVIADDMEQRVTAAASTILAHQQTLERMRLDSLDQMKVMQDELDGMQDALVQRSEAHANELKVYQTQVSHELQQDADRLQIASKKHMEELFDSGIARTDTAFQTMIMTVQDFLRELSIRMEAAQQTSQLLMDAGVSSLERSLGEAQAQLQVIQGSQEDLRKLQEQQALAEQAIASLDLQREEMAAKLSQEPIEEELEAEADSDPVEVEEEVLEEDSMYEDDFMEASDSIELEDEVLEEEASPYEDLEDEELDLIEDILTLQEMGLLPQEEEDEDEEKKHVRVAYEPDGDEEDILLDDDL